MRYNERVYWNSRCYGRVRKITTKHLGLVLDLLLPFTFGMIWYFMPSYEIWRY